MRRRLRPEDCIDPLDVTVHELEKALGVGGFGEVMLGAFHGGRVAVKKPREDDLGNVSDADVDRLFYEGAVLARLSHPHILRVFGCTVQPPQLIVEYHPRGSLEKLLRDGPTLRLDPRLKLKWTREIASAMMYFHATGLFVCHGDLALRNILISAAKEAIVADFGLVQSMTPHDPSMTTPAEPFGLALCRQAPEVILQRTRGQKSDVYSMGFIMWELLIDRPLFERGTDSRDIMERIARDKLHPEFPEDLTAIPGWHPILEQYVSLIRRCWSAYLDDRPTFAKIERVLGDLLCQYDAEMADDRRVAPCRQVVQRQVFSDGGLAAMAYTCIVLAGIFGRTENGGIAVVALLLVMVAIHARRRISDCIRRLKRFAQYRMIARATMRQFYGETPEMMRSPFDVSGVPAFAQLHESHVAGVNLPVPNPETWKELCRGMLEELADQSFGPHQTELEDFCTAHLDTSLDLEAWEDLQRIMLRSPASHSLEAWTAYARLHNRVELTGETSALSGTELSLLCQTVAAVAGQQLYHNEAPLDGGPDFDPGELREEDLGEIFRSRIGDTAMSNFSSGLSRESTG